MRAIVINGGIGDNIVTYPLAQDLIEKLNFNFPIYTKHPEILEFYAPNLTTKTLTENSIIPTSDSFIIMLDTFAVVMGKPDNEVEDDLMQFNHEFIETHKLSHAISVRPFKDGIATEFMSDKGFDRYHLLNAMLGLDKREIRPIRPEPLTGFWGNKYVTIHDGVGLNHLGHITRATKTWDLTHWTEFVRSFKIKRPDYKTIQLGTKTARRIEGVDYCFIDSFDIHHTFRILAHSSLHIDGESGLVHAAKSFGVKSIVLFGPTPSKYFGYKENINIQSPVCKPCWWHTDDWVKNCPRGYKAPVCMNAITSEKVLDESLRYLEK